MGIADDVLDHNISDNEYKTLVEGLARLRILYERVAPRPPAPRAVAPRVVVPPPPRVVVQPPPRVVVPVAHLIDATPLSVVDTSAFNLYHDIMEWPTPYIHALDGTLAPEIVSPDIVPTPMRHPFGIQSPSQYAYYICDEKPIYRRTAINTARERCDGVFTLYNEDCTKIYKVRFMDGGMKVMYHPNKKLIARFSPRGRRWMTIYLVDANYVCVAGQEYIDDDITWQWGHNDRAMNDWTDRMEEIVRVNRIATQREWDTTVV